MHTHKESHINTPFYRNNYNTRIVAAVAAAAAKKKSLIGKRKIIIMQRSRVFAICDTNSRVQTHER